MTKIKKDWFLMRLRNRLANVRHSGIVTDEVRSTFAQQALDIFRTTRAIHSSVVPGGQTRKRAASTMDAAYERAFKDVLRSIKP